MKILIAYYSRTGTTKKLADQLAEKLGADCEEIIDKKNRQGAIGWLMAGRDGISEKLTEINEQKYNPGDYDLVIIGTPVWSGKCAAAIRTYLKNNLEKINKLAVFTTQGSAKRQAVFENLKKFTNKQFIAELWVPTKEVRQDNYKDKLNNFINQL